MRCWQVLVVLCAVALCAPLGVSAAPLHSVTARATPATTTANQTSPAATDLPETVDPDTLAKGDADSVAIVRWLNDEGPGAGLYQLEVQNTSGIGYIDSFNWNPPNGMTVTEVTSSEGGKCALVGGIIQCTGKLAPPTCTCRAGGSMTVNFMATGLSRTFANGYWTTYGIVGAYLQISAMTPVPYHIPSFEPTTEQDIPLCSKNEKSTKSKPCAKG